MALSHPSNGDEIEEARERRADEVIEYLGAVEEPPPDEQPSPPGSAPWERPAQPGENCKCGRPAVVVYLTEKFGEVPYCGIPDGGGGDA